MPVSIISEPLLEAIRGAEEEIGRFLHEESLVSTGLKRAHEHCDRIASLRLALERVGALLSPSQGEPSTPELAAYARDLEKLRSALLRTQQHLLAARARMLREHNRLQAMSRWVAAAQTTEQQGV